MSSNSAAFPDATFGAHFAIEHHPVPAQLGEDRGLRSLVNLDVRHRFGDGPVIALNAHGGATHVAMPEAGVPIVIYGAGPRTLLESNAKWADENLVLEDLRGATKVVACALARLLAGEWESLPRQSA